MLRIGKKTVLYSAVILGASGMMMQGMGFVHRILLSRLLGAEGMGVYQLIFPVYAMFISIAMSGIGVAVTSLSASQQAVGDSGGNKRLVRLSLTLFVLFFIALAIPTVLFFDFLTRSIIGDERTRLGLMVMLPCIFFTGFENIYKSFFYGIKKVKVPVISEQLEFITRLAFLSALVFWAKPQNTASAVASVVLCMLISEIFSSLFLARLYHKEMRHKSAVTRTKTGVLAGKLARIAVPAALTGVVSNLFGSADTLLLPRRLMEAGLSRSDAVSTLGVIFGMAAPLMMLPMAVTGPIATIILPKLSEGLALKNFKDVRRKIGKALQAASLIAVPLMILLIPLCPALLQFIFHQTIPESTFALIALSTVLACYQMIVSAVLNGIGMPKRNLFNAAMGGCIKLFFTYYVASMPQWGIYGFLLGGIISMLATLILGLRTVVKKVNLKIQWMRWFILPIVSAGVAGLFCRLLFMWLSINRLPGIVDVILAFSAGIFVYLLALRAQGLSFFRYVRTLVPKAQNN